MSENAALRNFLTTIDIEKAFGVTFGDSTDVNVFCPFHENPDTSGSKSCSVSVKGLFNCKACAAKGDAVDFYAFVHNLTRKDAIAQLQETHTATSRTAKKAGKRRTLQESMVPKCMKNLKTRQDFILHLTHSRQFTLQTIVNFKLGCDETRITIPVYDENNELINLRRYLPNATNSPKMLSFAKGYGKPRLFPLNKFLQHSIDNTVILCEGEFDCILLYQYGFTSLTVTGGVSTWSDDFDAYFADRKVCVVYDVHDKSNVGSQKAILRAARLRNCGAKVKIVTLPLPSTYVGGDITDYFVKEKHTREEFQTLVNAAPWFELDDVPDNSLSALTPQDLAKAVPVNVTLEEASHSKYYYRKICIKALVAGKGTAPFLPPKHVSIETVQENGSIETTECTFNVWKGVLLSLIHCSTARLHSSLKAMFGIPPRVSAKVQVLDTLNIEEVFLIPSMDTDHPQGTYTLRHCYYAGHGLKTNQVYEFEGYTLPHPENQAATHVLTKATPAETDIDTFTLTEEDKQTLYDMFQGSVTTVMDNIAHQLSEHVTKIYGRRLLHTAIDLVFHSSLSFTFTDVKLRKGWLETLILGDTRTGKGFVAEGLCRHYKIGEVVSGENLSIAGLVGGVQQVGNRWTLVWGKIPLADRRLIIIDETGSLSHSEIARLSRIRSEGIAEITKIVSEKTSARTRLIWIANPKPSMGEAKRLISDYNFGIESVPELIGAAEDIARFDYAIILAHNEVSSSIINRIHVPKGTLTFTSEICHKLIMWVWSRKPSQIVFDKGVETFILKASHSLAKRFTPKIPLIQGEDVRFKLARGACAVAGRVFSTPDGETLLIKKEHVEFMYNFLVEIYSTNASGYAQLSDAEVERSMLISPAVIKETLEGVGECTDSLIDGLLEHRQISIVDVADYGNIDKYHARSIISTLVTQHALLKEFTYYVKKPAFKKFLHALKHERNQHEY